MSKKVALITGGSRGIGAATAIKFAENGFDVCINYVANKSAAEDVANTIDKFGVKSICVKADISNEQEVIKLFATVDQELGCVSAVINNAAILTTQTRLENIDAKRLNTIFQTNVTSAFLCCREAVRRMSYKNGGAGGVIVNVSSNAAKTGSPNEYIDYAASKGAIDTLTKGLALEVADEGIRVNAVRPGLIYTEMHTSGGEPNRVDRLKNKIPMQRGGQATEVAEAIYWLASDHSSFSTGSFIDLTGGL